MMSSVLLLGPQTPDYIIRMKLNTVYQTPYFFYGYSYCFCIKETMPLSSSIQLFRQTIFHPSLHVKSSSTISSRTFHLSFLSVGFCTVKGSIFSQFSGFLIGHCVGEIYFTKIVLIIYDVIFTRKLEQIKFNTSFFLRLKDDLIINNALNRVIPQRSIVYRLFIYNI